MPGQLAGPLRQVCADLRRKFRKTLVPGKQLQAVLDQLAGTTKIASLAGQPRPQKRQLRPRERGVTDKPVEAILRLGAHQPLQQQDMPLGELVGPVSAGVIRVREHL